MFILYHELYEKIRDTLQNVDFCALNEVCYAEDCSCKGGCGTYTPPCSCCAYD